MNCVVLYVQISDGLCQAFCILNICRYSYLFNSHSNCIQVKNSIKTTIAFNNYIIGHVIKETLDINIVHGTSS